MADARNSTCEKLIPLWLAVSRERKQPFPPVRDDETISQLAQEAKRARGWISRESASAGMRVASQGEGRREYAPSPIEAKPSSTRAAESDAKAPIEVVRSVWIYSVRSESQFEFRAEDARAGWRRLERSSLDVRTWSGSGNAW